MVAVAEVAEVISWVGLPVAALFAVLWLVLRLIRGAWRTATAVVVEGEVRWFGEGDFHSAPAPDDLEPKEGFEIFYRTGRPDEYHLERVAHDESTYRFLTILLGVIGVVALVVSTVASFV